MEEKPVVKRSCDGCTRCCEGWLHNQAYGEPFYKGRPCFFVEIGKKCSIYKNRPEDPCKQYLCEWMKDNTFPAWMKPSAANVIITKREKNGIPYYEVAECGVKMDSSVLNYMVVWVLKNQYNLLYFIEGGMNRIGTKEFTDLEL